MIIGVQHFSYAGTDTISFKVFPTDYPQDALWLHYVIIIDQGSVFGSAMQDEFDFSYVLFDNHIQLSGNESVNIKITDVNGRVVLVENNQDLNINPAISLDLSKGIYVVNLINKEGVRRSFKIVL